MYATYVCLWPIIDRNTDWQEDLTRHSNAAHVKAFQEATKGNIEAKVQVFQPVWGTQIIKPDIFW